MNSGERRRGTRAMKGGQLQLEAMICLAASIAILGLFLSALNEAGAEAGQAVKALEAKSQASLCCLAADMSYSGGITGIAEEMRCLAKGRHVESTENTEKSCESIAPEVRVVQEGEKTVFEVRLNEHYR